MNRGLAAVLAGATSLALFAAAFAAVAWLTHSPLAFWIAGHPHAAQIVASATSLLISVVVVPLVVLRQRRNADED